MSVDLCYLPASRALEAFRRRDLSPVELMRAVIERIEAVDPVINALPIRFFDQALAAASDAEARYAGRGVTPRPLEGLPVAVKDEIAVEGQPATAGSLLLEHHVADHTAPAIQRILDAGGIIHARSTTPEFCCAAITDTRLWGVTRNPWNSNYSPGGSSGGSGAALAAGMAALATGSDLAGSIRIPASFCGVVGFKPPYGRVPQDPPFNLDHYRHDGPMARTVEDCRLLENVMAGPHPHDVASVRPKLTIPVTPEGIEGLRVAVCRDLGGFVVDAQTRANLTEAAAVFGSLGASVSPVEMTLDLEEVRHAVRTHIATMFGGVLAQSLQEYRDLMTSYAIAFSEDMAAPTVDYCRALEIENEVCSRIAAVFEEHDVLIAPVFGLAELAAGAEEYDHEMLFRHGLTLIFNMCSRYPVLVLPCGRSLNGVPVGVQIVGRTYDDVSVFRAASAFAAARPWFADSSVRPESVGHSQ